MCKTFIMIYSAEYKNNKINDFINNFFCVTVFEENGIQKDRCVRLFVRRIIKKI